MRKSAYSNFKRSNAAGLPGISTTGIHTPVKTRNAGTQHLAAPRMQPSYAMPPTSAVTVPVHAGAVTLTHFPLTAMTSIMTGAVAFTVNTV